MGQEHRTVLEIEEKFFCSDDITKIKEKIEKEGFKFIRKLREKDEYFTNINGEYIKNRTCLRIRTIDDKELEVTYKGKSEIFSSYYAKKESNIISDVKSYNNIVELFRVFGYHSYVTVDKEREYYSKTENDITYNILIDSIINVGEFLEFEIILDANAEDGEKYFSEFMSDFSNLNLKKADLPYRDFVAGYYYDALNLGMLKNVHIESHVDSLIEEYSLIYKAKEAGLHFSSNIIDKELFEENLDNTQVIDKHQEFIEMNGIKLKDITQLLLILLYK